MNIKAVIFDMDGVILNTEPLLAKYWCMAAREFGFPMEYEHALTLRSMCEKYASPFLKKTFGESFDYRTVRSRRKELMNKDIEENGLELKPGIGELLDYIDTTELKAAVATATDMERAERYLKSVGLYDRFDKICCGPMVKNGKPDPDLYLFAVDQIGMKPSECIAIEDSPNGIKSAYGAGLNTIMVPDLSQPDEELKKMLFKKCGSLTDVIEELKKLA